MDVFPFFYPSWKLLIEPFQSRPCLLKSVGYFLSAMKRFLTLMKKGVVFIVELIRWNRMDMFIHNSILHEKFMLKEMCFCQHFEKWDISRNYFYRMRSWLHKPSTETVVKTGSVFSEILEFRYFVQFCGIKVFSSIIKNKKTWFI